MKGKMFKIFISFHYINKKGTKGGYNMRKSEKTIAILQRLCYNTNEEFCGEQAKCLIL
jgi:hypothetical protein